MDDSVARGRVASAAPRVWAAIVDDHPVYRMGLMQALRSVPDFGIAWTAGSPQEALDRLATTPPDLLITDLNFKDGLEGIELIRLVRSRWPEIRVAVVSALAEDTARAAALAAGSAVFLAKDLPAAEMVEKLLVLRPAASRGNGNGGIRPAESLSRREMEVLAEMRKGSTNREIAASLGISTNTVNKHVHRILSKLNARNRAQAISRTNLR
jgi:DNA-binding NarL/FixJ family response regulator